MNLTHRRSNTPVEKIKIFIEGNKVVLSKSNSVKGMTKHSEYDDLQIAKKKAISLAQSAIHNANKEHQQCIKRLMDLRKLKEVK